MTAKIPAFYDQANDRVAEMQPGNWVDPAHITIPITYGPYNPVGVPGTRFHIDTSTGTIYYVDILGNVVEWPMGGTTGGTFATTIGNCLDIPVVGPTVDGLDIQQNNYQEWWVWPYGVNEPLLLGNRLVSTYYMYFSAEGNATYQTLYPVLDSYHNTGEFTLIRAGLVLITLEADFGTDVADANAVGISLTRNLYREAHAVVGWGLQSTKKLTMSAVIRFYPGDVFHVFMSNEYATPAPIQITGGYVKMTYLS